MAQNTRSVLVYERIDANRRNTRWLMAVFLVLLFPLAGGLAQHLTIDSIFTAANPADVLTPPPGAIAEEVLSAILVLVTIALASVIVAVQFSSAILLQHAGARRLQPNEHPELRRTVENLCIGAGLPQPAIYLVDSDIANSFAVGRDPAHASLVVTTGLLALLTPRELAAVIAHELSHIGNYDTRLGTMLAAVVATLRWPWGLAEGIGRYIKERAGDRDSLERRRNRRGIWLFLVRPLAALLASSIGSYLVASDFIIHAPMPATLRIWRFLGIAMPFYVLLGAPAMATRLRRTISHEREFLADADAVLLTRDPGGLELALAKVGQAVAPGSSAGAATAHLYFVDPLRPGTSWWNTLYEVHPALTDRILRVSSMGMGVPPSELEAAITTGKEYGEKLYTKLARQQLPAELVPPDPAEWRARYGDPLSAQLMDQSTVGGRMFRMTAEETPTYTSADGLSPVVKVLHQDELVTVRGVDGHFVRITAADVTGYISMGTTAKPIEQAPSQIATFSGHERPSDSSGPSLTPLYESPDGLSRIVARLPPNIALTSATMRGNFIEVMTRDGTTGYVARSANLAALATFTKANSQR